MAHTKKSGMNGLSKPAQPPHDYYSLESLQERLVGFLARHSSSCRLAVAIAGGGGHFLSTLAATPGASKVLLEGVVLYDRESYRRYVQFDYDNHHHHESSSRGQGSGENDDDVVAVTPTSTFRYASKESALYASQAALDKALVLTAAGDPVFGHVPLENMQLAMGLSSASALQSPSSNSSRRGSRAFVAVSRQDGPPVELEAHLATATTRTNPNGSAAPVRTRFDEDVFVSHCILTCLEKALLYQISPDIHRHQTAQQRQQYVDQEDSQFRSIDENVIVLHRERTPYGDDIKIQVACHSEHGCSGDDDDDEDDDAPKQVVLEAARRILRGSLTNSSTTARMSPQQQRDAPSVVLLVPSIRHDKTGSSNFDSRRQGSGYMALYKGILPPKSLVFPGSFYPPHIGHIELAKAALEATKCQVVWFELSLTNADKPSLQPEQVVERLDGFLELANAVGEDNKSIMPKHWGVILTNAPLFKQKVELLHPLQVTRSYSMSSSPPPLHFVIGTDTLVRLLDPKYYNNSEQEMLDALSNMPCQFVVGGRLEQKKNADDTSTPVFVTGQEHVDRLPTNQLRSKFTILPDFRVDVSSTELRKQGQTAALSASVIRSSSSSSLA